MGNLRFLFRKTCLNRLVKLLALDVIALKILRVIPISRKTPRRRLRYRIFSLACMVNALEAFSDDGSYRKVIAELSPRTFADLGCFVGYFALLIADETGPEHVKGLCIDANPFIIPLCETNIHTAGLTGVGVLNGAVGATSDAGETDFFVTRQEISSCVSGLFNPKALPTGPIRRASVKVIDVFEEWDRLFGETRVDVLKLDIEGSEILFLDNAGRFLDLVQNIIVEWHKWATSLENLRERLAGCGFQLAEVLEEDSHAGLAWFVRR